MIPLLFHRKNIVARESKYQFNCETGQKSKLP